MLELSWPEWIDRGPSDANTAAGAVSTARSARALDQQSAVQYLAPFFGIDDPAKAIERLQQEGAAVDDQTMAALIKAQGMDAAAAGKPLGAIGGGPPGAGAPPTAAQLVAHQGAPPSSSPTPAPNVPSSALTGAPVDAMHTPSAAAMPDLEGLGGAAEMAPHLAPPPSSPPAGHPAAALPPGAQVSMEDAEAFCGRARIGSWYSAGEPVWMAADSLKSFVRDGKRHERIDREVAYLAGKMKVS